jgi:hypothetical protein
MATVALDEHFKDIAILLVCDEKFGRLRAIF